MIVHKILRADDTELPNIRSCVYSERVNAEENVRPGCVSSASIEVEVYGTQGAAVSGGESLRYYQVNGSTETLIGVFYAEPNIDSRLSYRFKAYDAISKLDADFSARLDELQGSFPMTLDNIVREACAVAGVTFGEPDFQMSDLQIEAFYADGITCRQIVAWAAEIACAFVRCDTDGAMQFQWYATKQGYRIYPNGGTQGSETLVAYKSNGLQYENYTVSTINAVSVYPTDESEDTVTFPETPDGNNTLMIQNNLLLTGASESTLSIVAENIYMLMTSLPEYAPMTASLFPSENPFRAGDIVNVTDVQGNTFKSVVMSMTVYPYRTVLSSTGQETYEQQTKGNTKKGLLNLASNILRLKALFVESLEAVVARIDNLFAQEITVTGVLHSDDYNKSSDQTYAFDGMGIDFATKEISATNFAVSDDGEIFARAGKVGGFQFIDAGGGSNVVVNKAPTLFLDEDGNEASYSFSGSITSIVQNRTLYPWQPSQSWRGYLSTQNGTFVFEVENERNDYTLEYVAVTLFPFQWGEERETRASMKWYYKVGSSSTEWIPIGETTLNYCDPATLLKPTLVYMENPIAPAMQQFVSYRAEISVSNNDCCGIDLIYGGYAAMYDPYNKLSISTDGITVDGVDSMFVPTPTSAQEGYVLKVVDGLPTWVAS